MKKRKIQSLLIMGLLFFIASFSASAFTETWIVNELGEKKTEKNILEIDETLDIGKIRFRQSNETVGLFKDGDRITIILRNAVFVTPPIIENPTISLNNDYGQTGEFKLILIDDNLFPNFNSVTYELQKKTIDEYGYSYKNIDIVFHFNNIKPINMGDILVEFSGDTDVFLSTGPLVSNTNITLAEIIKKNSRDNINKNTYLFEDLSINIKSKFDKSLVYEITNKDIKIMFPQSFFKTGFMWDFYSEYNPYNFIVELVEYVDLKTSNKDFSKYIGAPIYEIQPKIKNRISRKETNIEKGVHYNGTKIIYSTLGFKEQKNIIPIKYVRESDGSYKKELISFGNYDGQKKEISFEIEGPGLYTIEQKEVTKVNLSINDYIAKIDNKVSKIDAPPLLIGNITYVPVRFIAESFGAEVDFLSSTKQVQIKTDGKTIFLPIDKISTELSIPAKIIEGRTMVPVRFVSEQLGAVVNYFAETRTIEIIK
jgi:hypothetical protein